MVYGYLNGQVAKHGFGHQPDQSRGNKIVTNRKLFCNVGEIYMKHGSLNLNEVLKPGLLLEQALAGQCHMKSLDVLYIDTKGPLR